MDTYWFGIIKKNTAENSTSQYSEKKNPKQVKCDPFMKENLEMKSSFLNSVMGGDIREKRCAFIIL